MVLIDEKREWDVSLSSSIRLNRTYNILHIIIMHIIHKAVQVTHTHTHYLFEPKKYSLKTSSRCRRNQKNLYTHILATRLFLVCFFVFFLSTSSVQKNSIILVCDVLATTITTTTSISISTTTGK